jgi:hypothetical protein
VKDFRAGLCRQEADNVKSAQATPMRPIQIRDQTPSSASQSSGTEIVVSHMILPNQAGRF